MTPVPSSSGSTGTSGSSQAQAEVTGEGTLLILGLLRAWERKTELGSCSDMVEQGRG